MKKLVITVGMCMLGVGMLVGSAEAYDRSEYGFKSYKPSTTIGYFSEKECKGGKVHVDHIMALKDFDNMTSGSRSIAEKRAFANDRMNHRAVCASHNMSKSNLKPEAWLKRANDGKGVEVDISPRRQQEYKELYEAVKKKYNLQ